MRVRLTTPGLLMLACATIAVAALVALQLTHTEPALVSLGTATKAGPQHALSSFNPAMVYEARIAGVVSLDVVFGPDSKSGSGFVADADGHIITSSHVVVDYAHNAARPDAIYIDFHSHERVVANLVGVDYFSDIAVLKVDPRQLGKLHPLPLGNSDVVVIGQPVAAIGAPFGFKESLSVGIVSGSQRDVNSQINRYSRIADVIQTDAAINVGNSGGPLLDARGSVIGVNQQIRTTSGISEGVGFAVPSNLVKRSMRQIITTGAAHYARLGIESATVTAQMARSFGLKAAYGALVAKAYGPAATAGITAKGDQAVYMGEPLVLGDHIVEVAGVRIDAKEDLLRVASRLEPGQSVDVVLYRAGTRRTVTLVTDERPIV